MRRTAIIIEHPDDMTRAEIEREVSSLLIHMHQVVRPNFTQQSDLTNVLDPDKVPFWWSVNDVIDRAEERGHNITREAATSILHTIKQQHSCSIGVNWDVVDMHIEMELTNGKD